jgi:DNA invertase Pin-like site-specific DNA recombinase
MRIGYARVSTVDQNLDLQRDALQRAGCVQVYEDKASGRAMKNRTELANALRALRKGDTLIVWRLDRLGRSLVDLVNIVRDLEERGVKFESISDHIDTSTAQGRMFMGVMASLAQYVRDVIQENTVAGLQAARARGRVGGRPATLDERAVVEIKALLGNPDITVKDVAARYQVSRATIYNTLGRAEKKKAEVVPKKRAPRPRSNAR